MLKNLKIGEKITVILPYDLTPYRVYGTLEGFYIGRYAQYENSIFLYIKPYRCRRVERVIITPHDTAFILNKNIHNVWRTEELKNNDNVKVSQLHRLTINDFNKNDVIYYHEYGQEIVPNSNYDYFMDMLTDYIINNDIALAGAINCTEYISYIKKMLATYNIDKLKAYVINEGYDVLYECIKKAIAYDW